MAQGSLTAGLPVLAGLTPWATSEMVAGLNPWATSEMVAGLKPCATLGMMAGLKRCGVVSVVAAALIGGAIPATGAAWTDVEQGFSPASRAAWTDVAQGFSPAGQPSATPPDAATRAEAARLAGRADEAIPLYRTALAARPRWAEGWFHLGVLLYERDGFAEAAAALRKATALAPKVGTGWVMLGLCEYRLGQHAAALRHIQRGRALGVSADPQFRQVMQYHEGLLLVHLAEFERAQETLDELSAEGMDSEELLVAQGLAALRRRPDELAATPPAGESPQRALILAAGRAQTLAARKRFDEAQRAYEQLTVEHPTARNVFYALGRYFVRTQQPDQAAAAYEREIANSPDHVPARLGLAAILAQTDPPRARRLAEAAVRLNPRIPLGHYLLGTLLLEAGEIARAITALETAERAVKDDPGVYYALSRAYARAGRAADAEKARATFTRLNEARQAAARRAPGGAP